MKKFGFFLIFLLSFLCTSLQHAKETLIYADTIDYDKDENLIAQGNVKVIRKNEIIISDLIIFKEKEKKIILPKEFQYKDSENNFYY